MAILQFRILYSQALLLEGARRNDELQHFLRQMPQRQWSRAGGVSILHGCTATEKKFLDWADGKKSLNDIMKKIGWSVSSVIETAHQLEQKGVIILIASEQSDSIRLHEATGMVNQALATIYEAIQSGIGTFDIKTAGQEFISLNASMRQSMSLLAPDEKGLFNSDIITAVYKSMSSNDKMRETLALLKRFVSYILFSASANIRRETHACLSTKVNEMLNAIKIT